MYIYDIYMCIYTYMYIHTYIYIHIYQVCSISICTYSCPQKDKQYSIIYQNYSKLSIIIILVGFYCPILLWYVYD